MKIFLLLLFTTFLFTACSKFYFKTRKSSVVCDEYGPFTIKMETVSNNRHNLYRGFYNETHITYSVWFKGKIVNYPGRSDENRAFSYLWEVYILEGAPSPTLIVGSQSLYLLREENEKATMIPLNLQTTDYATLQYLDGANNLPGEVKRVVSNMTKNSRPIERLKGGEYLLVNNRVILHVPDLTTEESIAQNQSIDQYHFTQAGGAQSFSPDKRKIVFMGSKVNPELQYDQAMIVYDIFSRETTTLPYDKTLTRSRDLSYENREWFQTYFEWIKNEEGSYNLQLRKYDVLPFWNGVYKDKNMVFELSPVRSQMQEKLVGFIRKHLELTEKEIPLTGEQNKNTTIINYKNYKLNIWLRPQEKIVTLSVGDAYTLPENEVFNLVHDLGDGFNKVLSEGQYQEFFSEF
jgi:hypothetical protein